MTRAIDRIFALLLDRRVRRVRRWSFVVTLPLAALVISLFGWGTTLGLVALRVLLFAAALVAAWKLGGERGEAIMDLLMHPRLRRFMRAEARVILAPLALLVRRRREGTAGYTRGSQELPLLLALTPALAAETAAAHLLLPHVAWLHLAVAAVEGYALLWLLGLVLGPYAYPHRRRGRALELRAGPLFRAVVPVDSIAGVEIRRRRGGQGLVVSDEAAMLTFNRRVDVWLELREPVAIERPLGEPVLARRVAVAADDPAALVRLVEGPAPAAARVAWLPAVAPADAFADALASS